MERMTAAGRLGPPLVLLGGVPRVCALLDNSKSHIGTVGLEYIVELVGGSRKEPALAFECVLCATSMTTKGAVVHHVLQNVHKVLYLQKHFPLSLEPLRPFYRLTNTKVLFDGMHCRLALRYICQRIEDRFGRLLPAIIRFEHYMRSKRQYVQQIENSRHFVEDAPVPLDHFQDALNSLRFDKDSVNQKVDSHHEEQSYYEDDGRYEREDWVYNEEDFDDHGNLHPQQQRERFEISRNVENLNRMSESMLTVTKTVSNNRYGRPDDGNSKSRSSGGVTVKAMQPSSATASASASSIAKSVTSVAVSAEVYAKYRLQLDKATAEVQATLFKYETMPDQHPLYPTEWKTFWQRRSLELQKEGKEPAAYDFSADWTRFWLVRVHELNDDELKRVDRRIRRDLELSLDGEIVVTMAGSKSSSGAKQRSASKAQSDSASGATAKSGERDRARRADSKVSSSNAVAAASKSGGGSSISKVSTTDRKREQLRERGTIATESSSRSRSDRDRSPAGRETNNSNNSIGHASGSDRSTTRPLASAATAKSAGVSSKSRWSSANKSSSSQPHANVEPVSKDNDNVLDNLEPVTEPVTVISVLRLLSAFEDLLGSSLGPRVVDLLSKAVALEKVKANLADELLMSADNSVLLDTVKEKLKGLLLAGCVEQFKVRSVRKVIAHVMSITRIIDQQTKLREEQNMADARLNLERLKEQERLAAEQRKLREAEQKRREEADTRGLVMKQLATSITLQGKMISKEQLEALTDVYLKNHSADDTPYLFGLQMGSRFPDLKEDSNGSTHDLVASGQQQQNHQQQRGQQHGQQQGQQNVQNEPTVECPDQHPMLWNAHHQPQGSNYGGQYNAGQQQQQQSQQQFQYGYYNNNNGSNGNNFNNQPSQQQQQQYMQQQHSSSNVRPNLSTVSTGVGNDRSGGGRGRSDHRGGGQVQLGSQSSTTSYERTVTLPYQHQQHQPMSAPNKSSSSSARSSRTTGSSGNHRSSYY